MLFIAFIWIVLLNYFKEFSCTYSPDDGTKTFDFFHYLNIFVDKENLYQIREKKMYKYLKYTFWDLMECDIYWEL